MPPKHRDRQQHHGHGVTLLSALEEEMRQRGIGELQTAIDWTDHVMARFFGGHGFVKAPRHIIAGDVEQLRQPGPNGFADSDDQDDDDETYDRSMHHRGASVGRSGCLF